MASNMYQIKAEECKGTQIILEVKIISPDEYYFYESKNFVLQLLWDSAQLPGMENVPLNETITMDEILNEEWVLANQDKFIDKIEIKKTDNYPTKEQMEKMSRADLDKFRKEQGIPVAIYEIMVTDVKWGKHIQPGIVWESAAYDIQD